MPAPGPLGRLKAKVSASLRDAGRRRDRSRGGGPAPSVERSPGEAGGIVVSYAPEADGDADPGEVVWTWVPYEDDPSQGKDRPVLVLGREGSLLVGVQLSSKDHSGRDDAREWVPVGTGGWDREARPSYADASRLLRIDPGAVRREGSALTEPRFREVLARVTQLHDWEH